MWPSCCWAVALLPTPLWTHNNCILGGKVKPSPPKCFCFFPKKIRGYCIAKCGMKAYYTVCISAKVFCTVAYKTKGLCRRTFPHSAAMLPTDKDPKQSACRGFFCIFSTLRTGIYCTPRSSVMWTSRKIAYSVAGLLLAGLFVDAGAYYITKMEEVLWCYLAFLSLSACGFILYLKMR